MLNTNNPCKPVFDPITNYFLGHIYFNDIFIFIRVFLRTLKNAKPLDK